MLHLSTFQVLQYSLLAQEWAYPGVGTEVPDLLIQANLDAPTSQE